MRYFLDLSVILFTTVLRVVPVATIPPASNYVPGFECEVGFISDVEITNALIISKILNPNLPSLNPYNGLHFLGDGLLMYPVITHERPKKIKSLVAEYFVVYQNPGRVVGVFALTRFNEHVYCSRNSFSPHTPPVPNPDQSPLHTYGTIAGFQCGLESIENDLIIWKLLFMTKMLPCESQCYTRFPESIPGLKGTALAWPLVRTDNPSSIEKSPARSASYLITDELGSFVQASYRLPNGKYERCNMVKTNPNSLIPKSRRTNRENIKLGFLCDIFFDDDFLSDCAKLANEQYRNRYLYPIPKYLGDKIGHVLIWPIFANKTVVTPVRPTRYSLVINSKFKVSRVLRYTRNHGYRNCLRLGIEMNQEPEKSDFTCDNQTVENRDLTRLAEASCKDMGHYRTYPRTYRGPSFDVFGPYLLSQPNIKIKRKRKRDVKYQAVMTHDCTLVGAVVETDKGLRKCSRVDGSTPGGYSEYPITEISRDFEHVRLIYESM
ncbi:putative guanyl-specific ribonuclease f1 [Golovinomyces cichoracearum]|uniref:Putative guanyl-specific ribonuclease f1 n=1 Tax=Golovinomyces cichoracearum TaxID=62708 RepID=A0A420I959_9PEZI|nr:putative guanyl-specific ribonuclease f1 [Golovinomyces cichoracearum]